MSKYDIRQCIHIFMYDDYPEDFEDNYEQLMQDILIKMNNTSKLSEDESVFLIFCFHAKVSSWGKMCDDKDDMPLGEGDFSDFLVKFTLRMVNIQNFIFTDYKKEQLPKYLSDMIKIYRDAKAWMLKKGYKV